MDKRWIDFIPFLFFFYSHDVPFARTTMTPAFSLPRTPNRPLAALRTTALESLFQSWRGLSGRRYICSVYPIDQVCPIDQVHSIAEPAFECGRAVVLAVRQTMDGAEIVFIFQPAASGADFASWAALARRCGAGQFHVHLLAETQAERDGVAADLRPQERRAAA
jgi:hypothetical protein